jgi:CRISPR-associated protein Csy3
MSNEKKVKMDLPSMLAFERKLEVSDGLMYAGIFENRGLGYAKDDDKKAKKLWSAIPITTRKNRATQSAVGIKDIDKTQPNPVASGDDQAVIPSGCDTLKVSWTMRIIGNVGKPFACNKANFETAITGKTSEFKAEGLEDLAFRYAYNIANGRFLWRNRVCAENVEIQVSIKDQEEPLTFNAYDFSLFDFDTNKENEELQKIATIIYQGLMDKTGENFSSVKVNAFVKLDESQQIFPSQEMNMNEKGKVLFQLNNCAAMHNVKIGNAIRTIDTWYGDNAIAKAEGKDETESVAINDKHPIAVEPYGSVTQRGLAYRPSKDDLYTLMLAWINGAEISDNNKKYVIANLIRGGVFSKKGSKE